MSTNMVPTALERLQQGDTSLCADKDTLTGVSSVLADLSNSRDMFDRMRKKGESLPYEFVGASGYNNDVSELSCSGTLTLKSSSGVIKPIINWNLRPNLSNPGSIIVQASVPDEVASAFWWTMTDKYPAPNALRERAAQMQTPIPADSAATGEDDDSDTAGQNGSGLDGNASID